VSCCVRPHSELTGEQLEFGQAPLRPIRVSIEAERSGCSHTPLYQRTGTFSSGKNGQVTASLTVSPPPSDITCPPGQSLELASVSYTNVVLTDTTNDVAIDDRRLQLWLLAPERAGSLLAKNEGSL